MVHCGSFSPSSPLLRRPTSKMPDLKLKDCIHSCNRPDPLSPTIPCFDSLPVCLVNKSFFLHGPLPVHCGLNSKPRLASLGPTLQKRGPRRWKRGRFCARCLRGNNPHCLSSIHTYPWKNVTVTLFNLNK